MWLAVMQHLRRNECKSSLFRLYQYPFANPHGLNDPNHYTTPHDMALIARAAFANDIVKTVASTRTYTLPATKNNPSGLTVTMGHKMLKSK